MNKIILIGAIRAGRKPVCGETMKNQLFLKRFNEIFDEVKFVDTYQWQKYPWVLLTIIPILFFNQKASVVISASRSARYLIKLLGILPIHKHVYFWVVGGNLPIAIKKGLFDPKSLNKMIYLPVQGQSMVTDLKELGVNNAVYVPNSKPIIYEASAHSHKLGSPFKFVFLSRIHPDKGIREIFSAYDDLQEKYKGQFTIDFYGKIEPGYEDEFKADIKKRTDIHYKGYMDLTNSAGYETLSSYDTMLFPTYWGGEGFPGVVIDAYIAGVPIIASDWNLNKEVVEEGITGKIIPTHDVLALEKSIESVINGNIDLLRMKKSCIAKSKEYDYRKVLSVELMKRLKLMV